jgi:hypothetical protein
MSCASCVSRVQKALAGTHCAGHGQRVRRRISAGGGESRLRCRGYRR